ncbi:NAD(P)-dependent alcohol dehydrogenase [Donghicola sp. C2-DW-16]|uniref:NAD(P)-dependent alcohol dehydrogenase n=1 Tax=Donghicola mangrovi TaxID=2729614 RepID=A0ABX2PAG5_9RHOB|nr:NAD(P)-dependent alcohol dehydrogenase [Donghicola mangrovi]NVO26101.1 NAD(P)-dependent alcohol dehydrogenase [Donghicola mangrovi]
MKTVSYFSYGAPDVLRLVQRPTPKPRAEQVQVRVHASAVTTADWRLRASAFPGGLWILGRMMFGLVRPRNPVLGMTFAGEVTEVGSEVDQYKVGQKVYGFCGGGGHAEYLTIHEGRALAPMPDDLDYSAAAAVPFGGLCALVFLRDVIKLRKGQKILVIGATGGVGAYATQIAKAMGGHVTAVCGGTSEELAKELGADEFINYRRTDALNGKQLYDVVFDCVGASSFDKAKKALRKRGLYVPLNFGVREIWQVLTNKNIQGQRIKIHVNSVKASDLQALNRMIAEGELRPVVDRVYDMIDVFEAHSRVQTRHARGTVVLSLA